MILRSQEQSMAVSSQEGSFSEKLRNPIGKVPIKRKPSTITCKSLALVLVSCLLAVQLLIFFPMTALHMVHTDIVNTPSLFRSNHDAVSARLKKRRGLGERSVDGTFNGGPLHYKTAKLRDMNTKVHCIGETYTKEAWKFRSCRFDNLFCYNTSKREYVIFASPEEQNKAKLYAQREYLHVSDSMYRLNETNAVSIGGINLKWGTSGIERIKWFPDVVRWNEQSADQDVSYYELPESTIFLPYHSLNGANPGHLVWDDFLSLYTLLRIFFVNPEEHFLLPLRYVLQDGERGLWASCDLRPEKSELCGHMIRKFWPLMVGNDSLFNFSSTAEATFVETTHPGASPLVCAKTGMAGLGPLTDHGFFKAHGWEQSDYKSMHNFGRGSMLYDFRNFMLTNLNIPTMPALKKPYRVVFSEKSSDIPLRSISFDTQIALVKDRIPEAQVESYILKDLTVHEQMEIASEAAVFVSLCGGGAVTAMFLPHGASAIIYYAENGGTRNGKRDFKPALLDWDIFNSMSHLRVNWVPRNSRDEELDLQILVMMIREELERFDQHMMETR